MKDALQRIPLKLVYHALNKKYFFGRLPTATIIWEKNSRKMPTYWATCVADPTGIWRLGRGRHYIPCGKVLIRMRLSYFASNPRQLVPVLLHEMIHGYLGAVFGQSKERHGEEFLFQLARVRGCGAKVSHKGETK